jgi:GNAT superfamily N-acetyltransferase
MIDSIQIQPASLKDREELLKLYFLTYGRDYPLAYGTDSQKMTEAIGSEEYEWLTARDLKNDSIIGSIVFELDRLNKVGKAAALVVHPDYRKAGIGSQLLARGNALIGSDGFLNSIYTTTRTQNIGPQLICLREGYLPLGIFPNAHKLKTYETTTLMVKFKEGALEKRISIEKIPQKLIPLYEVVRERLPEINLPKCAEMSNGISGRLPRKEVSFEAIFAPNYVLRRFRSDVMDPQNQFYPFHSPNLLLAEENGNIEVFAFFNKSDGYCTLISFNPPIYELEDVIPALLDKLHGLGVSYVEVLVGTDRIQSIEVLLRSQFLPSALYPAMREVKGRTYDFVVMTRTMEPLNFRGMQIEQAFKPYIDQYVNLWKSMYLETLEVFRDYE